MTVLILGDTRDAQLVELVLSGYLADLPDNDNQPTVDQPIVSGSQEFAYNVGQTLIKYRKKMFINIWNLCNPDDREGGVFWTGSIPFANRVQKLFISGDQEITLVIALPGSTDVGRLISAARQYCIPVHSYDESGGAVVYPALKRTKQEEEIIRQMLLSRLAESTEAWESKMVESLKWVKTKDFRPMFMETEQCEKLTPMPE